MVLSSRQAFVSFKIHDPLGQDTKRSDIAFQPTGRHPQKRRTILFPLQSRLRQLNALEISIHDGNTCTASYSGGLSEAATLFSNYYGTYAAAALSRSGQRVHASPSFLRNCLLPPSVEPGRILHVTARSSGDLIGSAFACLWDLQEQEIGKGNDLEEEQEIGKGSGIEGEQEIDKANRPTECWITQLVVHVDHRKQGIATRLLQRIRETAEDGRDAMIYGIASSHPFSLAAFARAFSGINVVGLTYTQRRAADILAASPIPYLKNACVVVEEEKECFVDTGFFMDHKEPDEALETLRNNGVDWKYGALPQGHEYVLIVKSDGRDEQPSATHRSE